MATTASVNAAIAQFVADISLGHQIVHGGPDTVVSTEGGLVRSFSNVINQLNDDVNAAAESAVGQVLTARDQTLNAASTSTSAATTASNAASTAVTQATTATNAATSAQTSASTATTQASAASTHAGTAQTTAAEAAASAVAAAQSASVSLNAPGTSASSTTNLTIGSGSKALTLAQSGKAFVVGQWVYIANSDNPSGVWMHGTISAFNSSTGAMTVNSVRSQGAGTSAAWLVMPATPAYDSITTDSTGAVNITSGLKVQGNAVWHTGNLPDDMVRQRASVAYGAQDSALTNGVYKVSDPSASRLLFTMNVGGSVGPLQQEFDYLGTFRFRSKIDSASWSAWKSVWHSGNFNPASYAALGGANFTGTVGMQQLLDLTGPLYLRSDLHVLNPTGDAWQTVIHRNGGNPTVRASQMNLWSNGRTTYEGNGSWGGVLIVGGDGVSGISRNALTASIATTNGNLHIDSGSGRGTHLNFYSGAEIIFGNGASGIAGTLNSAGNFAVRGGGAFDLQVTAIRFATGYDAGASGSVSASGWFRSSGATGWTNDTYGGGLYMTDNSYLRTYGGKSLWVNGNVSVLEYNHATGSPSVILRNRTPSSSTHTYGSILWDAYRDVADPCYVAAITAQGYNPVGTDGIQIHFRLENNPGAGALPTSRGYIDVGGNLVMNGNITGTSDECLKDNWRALPADFVELMARIKVGTYDRIDIGQRQAGVSAQDLRKALVELAPEGNDGLLTAAYGQAGLLLGVELAKRLLKAEEKIAMLEAA